MKKFWAVISILTMFIGIDFSGKTVKVEEIWARAASAGAEEAMVYMTIDNKTDEEDTLTDISTEAAGKAAIMEVTDKNGATEKNELKALVIPAKQSKVLKPHGGAYISLSGLRKSLSEGDRFPITLIFSKKGVVDTKVHVEAATATLYEKY
jgi:copper(I)-binding protein